MAEALYRKYRPQVFGDVVGQEHIERTLKNALEKDQISHAYLFSGPRGTGKTTTARLLAKALLCEGGPTPDPDGTCRECKDIAAGVHPDVYELDAASRTGVDNVREEIISRINYAPTRGKSKVYIIDEVHMLSAAAFNALLKTLEEPPSHVVFVLCTTDPQKVPPTIHSRCQRFDFHRLSNDEIVTRLGAICVSEGVEFEGDALDLIAHRAEGGMRNALTSLEQLIAFGEGHVTVQGAEDLLGSLGASDMAEIMHAIGTRDIASCFSWTANYVETGADLAQFAHDMAEHVRNLYVLSLAGADVALEISDAERSQLTEELNLFGPERVARLLGVLGDLVTELRNASNPRLCFEIALTRMVRPDSDLTLAALAERIEALEAGSSAVVDTGAAPLGKVPPTPEFPAVGISGAEEKIPSGAKVAPPEVSEVPAEPVSAPAPASAPVAQGDLSGLLSNPAALQRVWSAVMGAIKKEKQAFAALLVGVRARPSQDGTQVSIEFPSSNPLSLSMARKPEMHALITRSLEAAAGFPVPFELVQNEGTDRGTAPVGISPPTPGFPAVGISGSEEVFPETTGVPFEPDVSPVQPQPSSERGAPSSEAKPSEVKPPEVASPGVLSSELVSSEVGPLGLDSPEFPEAEPQDAGTSEALDAQDLSKMFSETMGSSIVFEEVDE